MSYCPSARGVTGENFNYLGITSLLLAAGVCWRWYNIKETECIWKDLGNRFALKQNQDDTWQKTVLQCLTFFYCADHYPPEHKTIVS